MQISFSQLYENNKTFRLDSGFFNKEVQLLEGNIKLQNHRFLAKKEVVSGPFGSTLKSHSYQKTGIPFVRIENIKGGFSISSENMVYISEEDNQLLKNSQLYEDDIVLSKVGNTIGFYARVDSDIKTCNISENNIGIKLSSYEKSYKHYLLAYFNSSYGQKLTLRRISGNAQPKLNVFDINEIPIPSFNTVFYDVISSIIQNSKSLLEQSKTLYTTAENILLSEIGLTDFTPSHDPVNIKTFAESFATSGRLDAEYYQRKYDDYTALIHAYKGGAQPVIQACPPRMQNFTPLADTEYQYIELSNIGKSGDINGCTVDVGANLPSRARRLVHTGNVIISSIEGSLDSCALVGAEYDNALCSTGFYVINSTVINPETLLVLFKSPLLQNLLKKNCSGTILTAINKDEFLSIPVPLIDPAKQSEIASLITQSFALKKQSEHLLDVAKRAVEIAIEQDEAAAMAWIAAHALPA